MASRHPLLPSSWLRLCVAFVMAAALASPAHAQSTSYATDCVSNVDNETIAVPSTMDRSLGNGAQAAPGDTLAVFTSDGVCAGYAVWPEDGSTFALAAAGPNLASDTETGFDPGETLHYKLYDVSAGAVVSLGSQVSYRSCATAEIPTCSDDGAYSTGSIAILSALRDGALPVELTSFSAKRNGTGAVLTWATAGEEQNAGFEVQHKANDASTWSTLSFVEGRGTTSSPQSYRFEAEDLDYGDHEFRLQQVDKDGTTSLSSVVRMKLDLDQKFVLSKVYPNPVQSTGSFDLAVRDAQTVTVQVFDLLGRQVHQLFDQKVDANRTHTLRVGTDRLASGTYFLRVRGDSFTETRRLTVVR